MFSGDKSNGQLPKFKLATKNLSFKLLEGNEAIEKTEVSVMSDSTRK